MAKAAEAFRTISEVADMLDVPKHVLRFWEGKFPQIRPMKRGGGRRFYRPGDVELLLGIRQLLHAQGYTIKGVQRILREQGVDAVKHAAPAAAQAASAGRVSTAGRGPAVGLAEAKQPQGEVASSSPGASAEVSSQMRIDALSVAVQELRKLRALLADGEVGHARAPAARRRSGGHSAN